ncbi:MAG: hypothetical protein IJZ23_05985 [Roseburia sp.]|nr:hypothetical protein [Roseburia sp.]
MTEQVSRKRIYKMIAIFLIMTVFSIFIGILKNMLLDQLLCLVVLDMVFFSILSFLLEHERLAGRLSKNRTTDYNRVLMGVLLASLLAAICGFLPEFVKPVLAIAIVMTGFSSEWIGLCISIYYSMILAITCNMSTNELIGYVLLVLSCSMLFAAWENSGLKKSFILIICCLQTIIPTVFYYMEYLEFKLSILIVSVMLGVCLTVALQLIYDKVRYFRENEIENILQDMLDEEYAVAKELRRFSEKDYKHGQLVSQVARECARIAGADEVVCAIGGLYYRIGILKGEQIAENGVLVAAEKCFPEKIYQLIKEYHGVLELPSTPESAIVQMIDGVLNRIEEMRANDEMNDWNKDMAIYHTLTEFSSNGMYNKAGLSMHKFLEIREYLVKEDSLL